MTEEPAAALTAATPETVEALIRHRLSAALGGWRGSIETALPTVVFVVFWTWQQDVKIAAGAALAVAVVLAVVRVVQHSSLSHVAGAVFATAIAAFFAVRSGRAEAAFLPGILTNAAFLALTLVSVATRWPAVGFIVGAGDPRAQEDPFAWRRDRGMVRVCTRLTWVLVGGLRRAPGDHGAAVPRRRGGVARGGEDRPRAGRCGWRRSRSWGGCCCPGTRRWSRGRARVRTGPRTPRTPSPTPERSL